jgi:hypothetical protein
MAAEPRVFLDTGVLFAAVLSETGVGVALPHRRPRRFPGLVS